VETAIFRLLLIVISILETTGLTIKIARETIRQVRGHAVPGGKQRPVARSKTRILENRKRGTKQHQTKTEFIRLLT
jgi:hypothetical protein